jgi:hypothetical protein
MGLRPAGGLLDGDDVPVNATIKVITAAIEPSTDQKAT